ncbi:MAG: 5-formyltetrahydrofolate cyclo-ligase [Beijerinckiaceae bacterium]
MDLRSVAGAALTSDIPTLKRELRQAALARRDALAANDRRLWSEDVARHVLALPAFQNTPGPVAGFWPMRSEIDVRTIMEAAMTAGKMVALPAIVDGEVQFREWAPGEALMPGGFGTWVPAADAAVVAPRLLIVPLVAFDWNGMRLGYGKGYYDRAIARLRQSAGAVATIGVGFSAQEVETLPVESWDQKLDCIVTERGLAAPAARG